ncbi:MAG: hypothetical protein H7221_08500 [Flavobacterium sp.]|nr:hypothetical protein [Flavobacterium sp.]
MPFNVPKGLFVYPEFELLKSFRIITELFVADFPSKENSPLSAEIINSFFCENETDV